MDSNAHNPLWSSQFLDNKGQELKDSIINRPLNICNALNHHNRNIIGITHMDVTIAGDDVFNDINGWQYLEIHPLPDHILFEFVSERVLVHKDQTIRLPKKYQMDFVKMSLFLF